MFERLKLPIILIFAAWIQACAAEVYVPVSHPTPLLESKGDFDGAVYASTNGTDLHAAYAFTNRFGLGTDLNYMYRDFDKGSDFQKHKYAELFFIYFLDLQGSEFTGLGAFGDPVYSRPDQGFKVEFLGNIGLGEGEELRNSGSDNSFEENFAKGRYSKFGLQSNIFFETNDFFIGVSPRLSYVSYYDLVISEAGNNPELNTDKTNSIFWEPALILGLKNERIRLESQIGTTRVLGEQPVFDYERLFLSIGVHINFNMLK